MTFVRINCKYRFTPLLIYFIIKKSYHLLKNKLKRRHKFFTSWIPITNYSYPALSYVKYSQFFHSLLSRLIIKLRLIKIFSKKIFVDRGDILFWNGNMIHQNTIPLVTQVYQKMN